MGKVGSGGMGMAMMTLGPSMAEVGNGEGKQQRALIPRFSKKTS